MSLCENSLFSFLITFHKWQPRTHHMAPKEDEDEVEAEKVRNENGNEATHGWHDGTLLPASFFL